MSELTPDEHWILKFGFYEYADPFKARGKGAIRSKLMRACRDAGPILEALVRKNVLSESPSRTEVRLTDYGHQLYSHFERQQEDWYEQEIAGVDDAEKDEILIRKGETFRAYWLIRKICLSARENLLIVDNYVGPDLFKLLSEMAEPIEIKVLGSDKSYREKNAAELAYAKLKEQNAGVQMRRSDDVHGRYIFIDWQVCYEVAHSIKDLGTKEATIKRMRGSQELYATLEKHWRVAKEV